MGLEDTFNVYFSHSPGSGSIGSGTPTLPKSAITVLEELLNDGPMTPKDITRKVGLAPRTISFALRKLLGQRIVKKVPNLRDMRQANYYVENTNHAKQLIERYGLTPL